MPEKCSECEQKYEPETGFYYGAMYVSYAIGVAIFVSIWVSTSVFFPDISAYALIGLVIGALVIFFPLSFRLARLVWANLFIKYKGDAVENKESTN